MFRKLIFLRGKTSFLIKEDRPEVGWYLYVYENDKCTHDYLQDTLDITKQFAWEEFDIPLDAWKEIEN